MCSMCVHEEMTGTLLPFSNTTSLGALGRIQSCNNKKQLLKRPIYLLMGRYILDGIYCDPWAFPNKSFYNSSSNLHSVQESH